jgi:hypothetical protein
LLRSLDFSESNSTQTDEQQNEEKNGECTLKDSKEVCGSGNALRKAGKARQHKNRSDIFQIIEEARKNRHKK